MKLIMPAEHGAWAWFFVPFLVGVGLVGAFSLPIGFILIGGFALFLLRQPLTIWLKARSKRGRQENVVPAKRWTLSLMGIAGISLVGLLGMERWVILWLSLPMLILLVVYAGMAWRKIALYAPCGWNWLERLG